MKPLRIFLGDITHNTVAVATDSFPLNIGFVAAYCYKMHGASVEISLFKFTHDLEDAINNNPPDVLGLSNYPWCHNIDIALFDHLADVKPEAIRVMGGPNFPHDKEGQERYLKAHSFLDAYVYLDGEVGFSDLVVAILEAGSLEAARESLQNKSVAGCRQLSSEGALISGKPPTRLRDLDEVPSPYLTGLMDPFFEHPISPMISTNRGCPFSCSFCHDGNPAVSKVNKFSFERMKAEVEYIAKRVPESTHNLIISDLNFGMYKGDINICETLRDLRIRTGYPTHIKTTTGKNSKERVIATIEKLGVALPLSMSVQSLDDTVLDNIKRSNIRVDEIIDLRSAIRKAKLPATSEVILGLPGETLESHVKTLGSLLDAHMDAIHPYTLMLLEGSEMNTPAEREKWGFKSKFRIVPLDFTKMKNGRNVVEIEEVVTETKTLSFQEYVEARKLAMVLRLLNMPGLKALIQFLHEKEVRIIDLALLLLESVNDPEQPNSDANSSAMIGCLREFGDDTVTELRDSPEEIMAFYDDDENFQRLVDGYDGKNLLQHYFAHIVANLMPEMINWICNNTRGLLERREYNETALEQFDEIVTLCKGLTHCLLGADRMQTTPTTTISYDYNKWLSDTESNSLEQFSLPTPTTVRFEISDVQFKTVEDTVRRLGRTPAGMSRTLTRIPVTDLLRSIVPAAPA